MRSNFVPAGVFVLALLGVACSADPDPGQSTGNTTADLLAQPVTDGMSTALAVDPSMVTEGPRVRVSDLGFDHGDESAVIKVVELSDFGCGYCKQFHDEAFDPLREQFMDTGMVEWKFVPFITGMFENSLAVTEGSECVMEQTMEGYEAIARRLWTDQREWKQSAQPEPLLRTWVSELGVDMDEYDSCLAEDRRIQRIASATTLARQVGVRGTPTFVIIGYPPLQGALPLEVFQQLFTTIHADALRLQAELADTVN